MKRVLKRLGWTGLLVFAQPIKLTASVLCVAAWVLYDVGREFVRDLRDVWTQP